ncbi:Uncharacterised protein [Mycobacteroides abscessus subsp. abscessus]|nr:Uncharacterised protein [Mycobacteroides abscessus subsp. abscessus]
MMSSSTTSFGGISVTSPSRRTRGLACPTMASLSRVFLARISWMMPIPLLAMISRPNSPLMSEPVKTTIANSTPRIALIRVKTLALMMSPTERPERSGMSLTLPSATRCATSSAVRPRSGAAVLCSLTPRSPTTWVCAARSRYAR